MVKQCEWCKKEFEAKTEKARLCNKVCADRKRKRSPEYREQSAKYRESNREYVRAYASEWRRTHPDRCADYYDKRVVVQAEQAEQWRKQNENYHKEYAKTHDRRDYYKARRLRMKQEAARAAYLADPINAARIAEANLSRMTPEEREAWHQKIEAEQEKRDRKERREALRREHAASQITPSLVITKTGDTFAHIEWAP